MKITDISITFQPNEKEIEQDIQVKTLQRINKLWFASEGDRQVALGSLEIKIANDIIRMIIEPYNSKQQTKKL